MSQKSKEEPAQSQHQALSLHKSVGAVVIFRRIRFGSTREVISMLLRYGTKQTPAKQEHEIGTQKAVTAIFLNFYILQMMQSFPFLKPCNPLNRLLCVSYCARYQGHDSVKLNEHEGASTEYFSLFIFSVYSNYISNSHSVSPTHWSKRTHPKMQQKVSTDQFSRSETGFNCLMFECSHKNPSGTNFLRRQEPAAHADTGYAQSSWNLV